MKNIIFWLDTHTTNPIAWPYVLFRSLQYYFEDVFRPKTREESSIKLRERCSHDDGITEFGLCEQCGEQVL